MTTKSTQGGFDELLSQIAATDGDMNKAIAEKEAGDDALIAAAAGGDAAGKADGDVATDGAAAAAEGAEGAEGGEGEGEGEAMGKSLTFVDESGVEHQAVDATVLLKSLVDQTASGQKAMSGILGLVQKQGDMIKSLIGEVQSLRGLPAGRKATLVVNEKPAGAAATAAAAAAAEASEGGISVDEFWGKCFEAQGNGDITASDISKIESELNHGRQPPADLVARIKRSTSK